MARSTAVRRNAAGSNPLTYSVGTSTCQYMENHRPVQALGPQAALGTAMSNQGEPILFSLDGTGNLAASAAATGAPAPGWTSQAIAPEVMATYPAGSNPNATFFGVSQNAATSAISTFMSVRATPSSGQGDDLWLLSGMDNAPDAPWLTAAAQRNWTKVAYDGVDPDIAAGAPLTIAGVRVLAKGTAQTGNVAVVHLVGGSGALRPFQVNPGTAPVWNALPQNVDYTSVSQVAVGKPDLMHQVGLYTIYSSGGSAAQLVWVSNKDPQLPFAAINPTALAVLPVTGADGKLCDEVYVSDGANLLYFPSNPQDAAQPIVLATPNWLTGGAQPGCSALYVGCDKAVVSLWGVTFSGQIFHMQVPFADRAVPANWSVPMPLMGNVMAADMHISDVRGLTTIFAVQNSPANPNPPPNGLTSVNAYTPNGPRIFELHKDHLANNGKNHWRKRPIHLPAEGNAYQTLQTYTHRIQFINQYAQPASNMAVQIATTSSVVLEVNNQAVTVSSQTGASVTTDAAGYLDVTMLADNPVQPTLTFTLAADSSATLQIDPTAVPRGQAAAGVGTPSTVPQGASNGPLSQQTSWYNSANLSNAQTCMSNIPASPSRSAPAALGGGLGDGLFCDIGDAVQGLFDDIGEAISVAVNDVGQLVITIGDYVFNALITTVEDIASAIVAVLSIIGAALEDVFQWLAFLFQWQNIKALLDNLYAFYGLLLGNATGLANALLPILSGKLSGYASQIASLDTSNLPGGSVQATSQSNANAQTQNTPSGAPAGSDPRMSWGQNQVSGQGLNSAAASPGSGTSARRAALGDSAGLLGAVATDLDNLFGAAAGAVTQLVENQISFQQFAQEVQNDAEEAASQLLNDLAAAVTQAQSDLASALSSAVKTLEDNIDIPLFSGLYQDATGTPLNWLSLFCLLQAVPLTFVYDMVTGGNSPASDFLQASEVTPLMTALQNFIASPAPPSASTGARPDLGMTIPSLASDHLRFALGIAHVMRMISTIVLVAAEESDDAVITVPAVVDCFIWAGEATLDILLMLADWDEATDLEYGACVVNGACALYGIWAAWQENAKYSVPKNLATASVIAGAAELINGGVSLVESGGMADTLDALGWISNGACEVLEPFAVSAASSGNEETATSLNGWRIAAVGFAGVMAGWSGWCEYDFASS